MRVTPSLINLYRRCELDRVNTMKKKKKKKNSSATVKRNSAYRRRAVLLLSSLRDESALA